MAPVTVKRALVPHHLARKLNALEIGEPFVKEMHAEYNKRRQLFVASLNEWSEGHYLEPDTRFGLRWVEAVRDGRK